MNLRVKKQLPVELLIFAFFLCQYEDLLTEMTET